MSRLRILGGALMAGLVALAVSGASASAATRLVLTENGVVVSPGEYALDYHLTFDGGCQQASKGEVLTNARPKDKLVFGAPEESECLEEGYGVSGALKQVVLTSAGAATLSFKPKLSITEPGPCVYEFARLTGVFPATIEVDIEGDGAGKLRQKLSGRGCASTRSIEFLAVESGITNDIFGAEVIG